MGIPYAEWGSAPWKRIKGAQLWLRADLYHHPLLAGAKVCAKSRYVFSIGLWC